MTPEQWRPVAGRAPYEVSDLGRVRNAGTQKVLTPTINHRGAPIVGLYKDGAYSTFVVAKLVARAFLGEPPTCSSMVHHQNGDKTDNCLSNLQWMERRDYKGWNRCIGTAHPRAKMTPELVKDMRRQRKEGATIRSLSEAFGVSTMAVRNIIHRKTWAHVQD